MTWNMDATAAEADWIKKVGWDFPAYGTKEFMKELEGWMTLDEFKKGEAYKRAVANGLIKDDKWTGKGKAW